MPLQDQSWVEITKPIIDRWKLCAKLNMKWVENPTGCAALASIVGDMARIIDDEIYHRNNRHDNR